MKLSGHTDSSLSDTGKSQIKKTFQRLKDEEIHHIYSSPLSRAFESAKELALYKNIQLQINDSFKEMNFGSFEGMSFKEIETSHEDEYKKLIKEGFEYRFPKGENMIDFHERISTALDEIIKNHKDCTVLIATHAGVIRSCISHLIGKNHNYHWNFKIDNCSISIVEVVDDFAVIHSLNNTEHLR